MVNLIKKLFHQCKAKIENNSTGNTIIQNSELTNPIFFNSSNELINYMGNSGQFDDMQKYICDMLDVAKKKHPLFPMFSATYNNSLDKLVSTPETEEALNKYPKNIKGKFKLDYKKYPNMNKGETPWDYAYRTQTSVELETTEYKEYLGDMEDPFPIKEYSDGMITVIKPSKFPEAVDATLVSGGIIFPFKLRRKPCLEYSQIIFGSVNEENGLSITITLFEGQNKLNFTFTKSDKCDLKTQILREKLINEINETKELSVFIGELKILNIYLDEAQLNSDMFLCAPYFLRLFEALLLIEDKMGIVFDKISDVNEKDYYLALMLESCLKNTWFIEKKTFDDDIRGDFKKIFDISILEEEEYNEILFKFENEKFELLGNTFLVEEIKIVYRNARINNYKSVIKNITKNKKNILLTFRPKKGYEYFIKEYKFEKVKRL